MGHIEFLNMTEEEFLKDYTLHKFSSLEYALRSLDDHTLWFANPATWKDPYEKKFILSQYPKQGEFFPFPWVGKVYCMCVTAGDVSEAHWKMYSREDICLDMQIERLSLLEQLETLSEDFHIFIGKAEYLKTNKIEDSLFRLPLSEPVPPLYSIPWYARLLLIKRLAFKYEDEVRIILFKKGDTPTEGESERGFSFRYSCENIEMFRRIVIGPDVPRHTRAFLKTALTDVYHFKAKPDKLGRQQPRVIQSQLYREFKDGSKLKP